jgi:tRNA threonylcarbamoyladenosine biosynthesis protein TsaE
MRMKSLARPLLSSLNTIGEDFPSIHIDLYRLEGVGIEETGIEEYLVGQGVAAVEWFCFLPVGVVSEYLLVSLVFVNEDERVLRLTPHGERYEQIVEKLLEQRKTEGV